MRPRAPRPLEACLTRARKRFGQDIKCLLPATLAQGLFQFDLLVEMILYDALVAAGYKHEMLDAGSPGFFNDVLDHRFVDDRQHFLGDRLGCRQKTGSKSCDRENRFSDGFVGYFGV